MFGLQKQRRNAAGGGAWFIAGHLTVFAKLSHHAVPLESRIFSSRCFSVPPFPPIRAWLLHISSPSSLRVTIRRRRHILIDPRNLRSGSRSFLRKIRGGCANGFPNFRDCKKRPRENRYPNSFLRSAYNFRNGCRGERIEVRGSIHCVFSTRKIHLIFNQYEYRLPITSTEKKYKHS